MASTDTILDQQTVTQQNGQNVTITLMALNAKESGFGYKVQVTPDGGSILGRTEASARKNFTRIVRERTYGTGKFERYTRKGMPMMREIMASTPYTGNQKGAPMRTITMSTVYVAKRNGQCQHCGHRFFSSEPNPPPICYHCESAGRTPSGHLSGGSETAAPIFETYDAYSAYDADVLRDAAMERELDEHGVAS